MKEVAIAYADQSLRLALREAARDTSHLCFSNFLEDERASSRKISLPFPLPQDLIFLVLEMEATDLYMLECLSLLENVKLKSMLLLD